MKNIFILFALSICPFISFTQKRYYTPIAYQISAHDRKGQISLSVARGNGYDANISYALTNHLSVLFAYNENKRFEKRTTILSPFGIQNNNSSISGRLGYFKNIKKTPSIRFKKTRSSLTRIETYLGYSITKIDNYWNFIESSTIDLAYAEYAKAKYNSVFIGSDFVYDESFIEFSTSVRFNFYKYDSFEFYEMHPYSSYTTSNVENYSGTNFELIFGLGKKYKGFQLLIQGGASIPILSPYAIRTEAYPSNVGTHVYKEKFPPSSFIFRLGLQFNSGYKKNK
jgi:hypothetical protein